MPRSKMLVRAHPSQYSTAELVDFIVDDMVHHENSSLLWFMNAITIVGESMGGSAEAAFQVCRGKAAQIAGRDVVATDMMAMRTHIATHRGEL